MYYVLFWFIPGSVSKHSGTLPESTVFLLLTTCALEAVEPCRISRMLSTAGLVLVFLCAFEMYFMINDNYFGSTMTDVFSYKLEDQTPNTVFKNPLKHLLD